MKKTIAIYLGVMLLLSACSTIQGVGEDIRDTGDDISSVAGKMKDRMQNY